MSDRMYGEHPPYLVMEDVVPMACPECFFSAELGEDLYCELPQGHVGNTHVLYMWAANQLPPNRVRVEWEYV